jgi:hypothetical protein
VAHPPSSNSGSDLDSRLALLGQTLGARESAHVADLQLARDQLDSLRERIAVALDAFHREAASAGAPHLRIDLSAPRVDEKHVRAVEFDLSRGRHKAIVIAKSRGEITLVGPFRTGKTEGPCQSFPFSAEAPLASALATFLEAFLEEAASP